MDRLVLHIGSHKTATTLVQRWMLDNADALRGRGVDYPNLREVVPAAVAFTQWDLFAALAAGEEHSRLGEGGLEPVLRRLASSTSPLLVLSAENCWGQPSRQRRPEPDYFPHKDAYAAHVVSTLRARTGRRVEVVAWLRRPDHFLLSLFNQAVKQTAWSSDAASLSGLFGDFVEQHVHMARYDRQLTAWERGGAEAVTVRVFGSGDGPLEDFTDTVGIDRTGLPGPAAERVNPSWGAAALLVKAEVNRHLDTVRDSVRVRKVIEEELGADALVGDAAAHAARDNVAGLQSRLADDLEGLRRRLGDVGLWADPWTSAATEPEAVDPTPIVRLAASLLLQRAGVDDG